MERRWRGANGEVGGGPPPPPPGASRVDGGGGCGALKALEDIGWELEWEALWRWMRKVYDE